MHYFAGLDIGTTHTKLVICTPSLEIIFQEKIGYTIGFGATLDADEIYRNTIKLLDQANAQLHFRTNQVTVTFSAAMHSVVLVDAAARPLTPLYTWADTSSLPVLEILALDPASGFLFFDTGTPLHPMSPFCKLAWMHLSTPELLVAAYKCVGIKELVWFRITGQWEIDHSLASATGMFSQKDLCWNTDALRLAGVKDAQLSLPVPVTRRIDIGNFHWVIGASDGCLAQLGTGAMENGTAALTIGTSGAIRTTLAELWIDEKKELFTYLLDEDHFVCGGSTNNGGIALQWWEQRVMEKEDDPETVVQSFEAALKKSLPGADGLVCLPYFGGERAPVWDAAARGVFSGIHNRHQQADFKRALLEGIGFSFRRLLEKLEMAGGSIYKIYGSGGFSQNPWWVQLMADILMKPILVDIADADASAMGAIGIGLKAEGKISDLPEFARMVVRTYTTFTPEQQTIEIYNSNYQHYCRLCLY